MRIKTHPGEILREMIMAPLGMPVTQLAESMDTDKIALAKVIRGLRPMTSELAEALAGATGTSADFWVSLQINHDKSKAERIKEILAANYCRFLHGWIPLVTETLNLALGVAPDLEITEIRQTSGELRITPAFGQPVPPEVLKILDDATEKSQRTCEACGGPARIAEVPACRGLTRCICPECMFPNDRKEG